MTTKEKIIKYRAKNLITKEWEYGTPIKITTKYYIISQNNVIPIDPITLGQYIHNKDIDLNPIYEGDIVDCSKEWWDAAGYAGHDSPILEVQWHDETCGFAPFSVYDSDCGVWIDPANCKIIGNIYDNPELLKDGE